MFRLRRVQTSENGKHRQSTLLVLGITAGELTSIAVWSLVSLIGLACPALISEQASATLVIPVLSLCQSYFGWIIPS